MRQKKSKLICKCGRKGGVLTSRRVGNSKTKSALYIQHYDPTKSAGKRPCYISKQNIALIQLNDKRYFREYISLVKRYYEISSENRSPEDNARLDPIAQRASWLLRDMGWPHKVVHPNRKFSADMCEISVLNLIRDYNELGIKATREQVFKKLNHPLVRSKLK